MPESVTTPASAVHWPTHTHPYPVPVDHDAVPHDPNLVHPHTGTAPQPAAEAMAVETTQDAVPHFTIAVGAAAEAYGVVAPQGSSAPHETTIAAEPLAEAVVDGKARLVAGLSPGYPDEARSDGIEGDVRLELVVGVSGAVESARVVQGAGHGLDESALRAIRQFRFAPATKDGHPVRVRMGWSMQFRLR